MRFIAHRGASQQYAEHTRAAYLQAIAEGADGLECDVQLSADHRMVLWHDATVDRTSNGSGPVQEHTLAQLRALDVVSWRSLSRRRMPWRRSFWRNAGWRYWLPTSNDIPPEFGSPQQQVLTLPDLVDMARASGRALDLMVEFKYPSPFGHLLEDSVLAYLDRLGWDPASGRLGNLTVYFMCFAPESLEYLLGRAPSDHLMFLLDVFTPAEVVTRGTALLDAGDIGGIGPGIRYVRAHPHRVQGWVDSGRAVRVWTVNTHQQVALCTSLGIQELTTNVPARLRAMLAAGHP